MKAENVDLEDAKMDSDPELLSVRRVPTFQRKGSSRTLRPSSGIDNPALDVNEQTEAEEKVVNKSQLVVEEDARSSHSSMDCPLTGSPTNNLDRQSRGFKRALGRVASLTSLRASFNDMKSSLPNACDFDRSWKGVESYLRQRESVQEDPEAFRAPRKPFFRRTWFICTVYVILLLILGLGIFAIAYYRGVLVPEALIHGQVVEEQSEDVQDVRSGDMLDLHSEDAQDLRFGDMLDVQSEDMKDLHSEDAQEVQSEVVQDLHFEDLQAIQSEDTTLDYSVNLADEAQDIDNETTDFTQIPVHVHNGTGVRLVIDLDNANGTTNSTSLENSTSWRTLSGEEITSGTVSTSTTIAPSTDQSAVRDWLFLLNLPGPLQRIRGNIL